MNSMLKKSVGILVMLSMSLLFLAGCGGSNSNEAVTSAPTGEVTTGADASEKSLLDATKAVTINFFTSSALNKTELDTALPDFYQKYPNIKVEVMLLSGADYATKVKTSVVAGEQVDVIETTTTNLERSQASSFYLELGDLAGNFGVDVQKIYGDYAKQLTVDGKLYGIPKYLQPAGIWYNKKMFDEAKIPYPTADWTWDEFFDLAGKLTVKDASGKIARYGAADLNFSQNDLYTSVLNLALYSGSQLFKDDGSLNIDDPNIIKAVRQYYDATVVNQSMPDISTIVTEKLNPVYDMYKGKWAMLIGGRNTAMFFDVHKTSGNLPAEDDEAGIYQLAFMPKWDASSPAKQAADIVLGDSIAKICKNPDEAFAFIQWHTTDSLVLGAKVAHRVPAAKTLDTKALFDSWTYYEDKDKKLVKGIDRSALFDSMLDPAIVPIFALNTYRFPYTKKVTDEFQKELSLLFTGSKTFDNAMADARNAMQAVVDKEKK